MGFFFFFLSFSFSFGAASRAGLLHSQYCWNPTCPLGFVSLPRSLLTSPACGQMWIALEKEKKTKQELKNRRTTQLLRNGNEIHAAFILVSPQHGKKMNQYLMSCLKWQSLVDSKDYWFTFNTPLVKTSAVQLVIWCDTGQLWELALSFYLLDRSWRLDPVPGSHNKCLCLPSRSHWPPKFVL